MKPFHLALAPAASLLIACEALEEPASLVPPEDVRVEVGRDWGQFALVWTRPPGEVQGYEVWDTRFGNAFTLDPFEGVLVGADTTRRELDFSNLTPSFELRSIELKVRSVRFDLVRPDPLLPPQVLEQSAFSPVVTYEVPIRPPRGFTAVIQSDGVSLDWDDVSQVATTIEVERSQLDEQGNPGPWSVLLRRPPMVASERYLDATAELGKAYAYRATSRTNTLASEPAQATTLIRVAPLPQSTIQLPQAPHMAADGKGNYAFLTIGPSGGPSDRLRFTWRNGAAWATATTTGVFSPSLYYPPYIKLDASGVAHAVYLKLSAAAYQITHGWSEGTQWREELIAERPLYSDSATAAFHFDVTSGAPVVAWILSTSTQLKDCKLEAAVKVGGTWTVMPLDSVIPNLEPFVSYQVFADQAGTLHLLVRERGGLVHLQPTAQGWTRELLPLPEAQRGIYDPFLGVGRDADHLAVCFDLPSNEFVSPQAACIRKNGPAGWGPVEYLGTLPFFGSTFGMTAALSPDGSRLALLYTGRNTHLFRSDNGGRWTETIINPFQFSTFGFDPANKLSVLSAINGSPDAVVLTDHRVESEP